MVYEAREKYKINTEFKAHQFFLRKGYKGVGAGSAGALGIQSAPLALPER